MQDAGLTIPTTYTEVLAFCADAQKAGKVAYALGAQTQWVTQLVTYALAATDVYSREPDFNQKQLNKEATFQDSKWLESMTKYKEMFDKGCFNKEPWAPPLTTRPPWWPMAGPSARSRFPPWPTP